jgi:hypothetical protein
MDRQRKFESPEEKRVRVVSIQRGFFNPCRNVLRNGAPLWDFFVRRELQKGRTTDGNLKDMMVPLGAAMLLGLKFNPPDPTLTCKQAVRTKTTGMKMTRNGRTIMMLDAEAVRRRERAGRQAARNRMVVEG